MTEGIVNKKIIVFLVALVTVMLVIPVLAVNFISGEDFMGFALILFFLVYPILEIASGIVAATDIRKLWWLPILPAATFPLFFAVAIFEIVLDLYLYSVIYLPIGLVAMIITYIIKSRMK